MTASDLVIASHNDGKVREIRELLSPLGFAVKSAGELSLEEPEEPSVGPAVGDSSPLQAGISRMPHGRDDKSRSAKIETRTVEDEDGQASLVNVWCTLSMPAPCRDPTGYSESG